MRKLLTAASLLALPVTSAWAQPDFYGRAHVSFELVDEAGNSGTVLEDNNSRVGLKGAERLNEQIELVYQLEYGVSFDDGNTFSQRNIFVGFQNEELGRVIAGHMDTPLKRAQGKVDLFNDERADIGRTMTVNENRVSNTVMYTTPTRLGPFSADVAWISSETDDRSDGKSVAISYQDGALYGAVALDRDVEEDGADASRLVAAYAQDQWLIGALLESSDTAAGDSNSGWMISGLYRIGGPWELKAQVTQSDIIEEGGSSITLGADYRLTDDARAFTFIGSSDADARDSDQYLAVGIDYKF